MEVEVGEPSRARTGDILLKREKLYRLSYGPNRSRREESNLLSLVRARDVTVRPDLSAARTAPLVPSAPTPYGAEQGRRQQRMERVSGIEPPWLPWEGSA